MPEADEAQWEHHRHEAMVHSHQHYHVTHNSTGGSQPFEHLSSRHDHEHDHAALGHSHYPHQDFDREHGGEAHVHDHDEQVREQRT